MLAENQKGFLNVTSEIGRLTAVLLHKPGEELNKLTPDYLAKFLFDDIPWLKKMQEEHDEFAKVLRSRGTEVYYIRDLLQKVLEDDAVKKNFLEELLLGSQPYYSSMNKALIPYLMEKSPEDIMEITIGGLSTKMLGDVKKCRTLYDYVYKDNAPYIDAVPNLYFMRDPAATIGHGISINSMRTEARRREPNIIKYIYEYHPLFKKEHSPLWYNHTNPYSIEGGDILVLSKNVIAIGVSERTTIFAVEILAKNLFAGMEELQEILVVQIPAVREFMHLDTVFNMIDRDKFTIFSGIQSRTNVFKLSRKGKEDFKISAENNLVTALKKSLKLSAVCLIQTGGGDEVTAAREQWNDGTNTLAISPGVVVTYSRNEVSNENLRQNGIEVVEIEGSELVRGRGGPRCMSMPLNREEV